MNCLELGGFTLLYTFVLVPDSEYLKKTDYEVTEAKHVLVLTV